MTNFNVLLPISLANGSNRFVRCQRSNGLQPFLLLRPFDRSARLPHDAGSMGALELWPAPGSNQGGACLREDFGVGQPQANGFDHAQSCHAFGAAAVTRHEKLVPPQSLKLQQCLQSCPQQPPQCGTHSGLVIDLIRRKPGGRFGIHLENLG